MSTTTTDNSAETAIPSYMMEKMLGMMNDRRGMAYFNSDEPRPKKIEQAEIIREGKRIILPEGMSFRDGMIQLQRMAEEDEKVISVSEKINAFPLDGAHALQLAIAEIYGWVDQVPTPSFFGDKPPQMIAVEIEYGKTINVPWGRFNLPNVQGHISTGYTQENERFIFMATGEIRKKHEGEVKKLFQLAREYAVSRSIYKHKAISIRFYDNQGESLPMPTPKFLDLSKVDENQIVFAKEVAASIRTNLYTPVERSEECRKAGIPLKRGVLLSGPYGTGKTLAAYVTAKKCMRHNWTYLYCEKADELSDMVRFAHQYQPAVIFCEDIDRVVEGERTVEVDDILNIVDGIESKNTEIMIVLTTNHVENINKAMLRPGRLDAIINVLPPDKEAVERLMRQYGRGLIHETEDLEKAATELEGKIPAVIRECVERSKLSAIGLAEPGATLKITGEALLDSAVTMRNQLELLNSKEDDEDRSEALIGRVIGGHIASAIRDSQNIVNGGPTPSNNRFIKVTASAN
jgi:transitional endoplasmic reticulum ATPase